MAPVLSACLVMNRCGDEIDVALRCIQNADLEVSVFLSDNSPEELTAERLKWAFPGVVILPQEKNSGLSRAYNAALPELHSKYHLMMDPGISFHPSLLRRMVSYMEMHPNIAILSPRFFSEEGEEIHFPRRQLSVRHLLGSALSGFGGLFLHWQRDYTLENHDVEMPVPVDTAPVSFMLIRTDVFKNLNGFDPRFFLYQEDSDLSRRVLEEHQGSIVYHPSMCVTHRWARENTRTSKGRMRQIRSAVKYFMKWGITW